MFFSGRKPIEFCGIFSSARAISRFQLELESRRSLGEVARADNNLERREDGISGVVRVLNLAPSRIGILRRLVELLFDD